MCSRLRFVLRVPQFIVFLGTLCGQHVKGVPLGLQPEQYCREATNASLQTWALEFLDELAGYRSKAGCQTEGRGCLGAACYGGEYPKEGMGFAADVVATVKGLASCRQQGQIDDWRGNRFPTGHLPLDKEPLADVGSREALFWGDWAGDLLANKEAESVMHMRFSCCVGVLCVCFSCASHVLLVFFVCALRATIFNSHAFHTHFPHAHAFALDVAHVSQVKPLLHDMHSTICEPLSIRWHIK